MIVKNINSIQLHKMVDIQSVIQDEHKPNVLYIEGYASFYQNELGIKEVDRDNEIVNLDGLDVTSYQKNPVLLWNHDWSEVRGKVLSVNKDGKGLYVRAEMQRLTGKEADFENVLHGNVKSFSIGFIPIEYDYLDNAVEITRSELIELSIAPVQSCRSALFQVVGTKSLDVDSKSLKNLLEHKQKGDSMIIKDKEVTTVVAPKVEPVTEPIIEPVKVVPVVEPVIEPVKVVTIVEPVKADKPTLDIEGLATQLVEAQSKADKIKQDAKDAAEAKILEDARLLDVDAKQKVTDIHNYIRAKKDEIAATPFGDLDTDELDEFVDIITETNDVIMGKINELLQNVQGASAE